MGCYHYDIHDEILILVMRSEFNIFPKEKYFTIAIGADAEIFVTTLFAQFLTKLSIFGTR
jgi:hypothetical protein